MQRDVGQQGTNDATLGRAFLRGVKDALLQVPGLEPLTDQFSGRERSHGAQQVAMVDVVKSPRDVRIHDPPFAFVWTRQEVDAANGIMAATSRTKSVAGTLKTSFPTGFQGIFDQCLQAAVNDGRDAEGASLAVGLGNVHPSCRSCLPRV